MIHTVKKNMCALVGDRLVDDETRLTVMCEGKKMINDRPLIRQCADPRDLSVLTPNTLLLGFRDQSNFSVKSGSKLRNCLTTFGRNG